MAALAANGPSPATIPSPDLWGELQPRDIDVIAPERDQSNVNGLMDPPWSAQWTITVVDTDGSTGDPTPTEPTSTNASADVSGTSSTPETGGDDGTTTAGASATEQPAEPTTCACRSSAPPSPLWPLWLPALWRRRAPKSALTRRPRRSGTGALAAVALMGAASMTGCFLFGTGGAPPGGPVAASGAVPEPAPATPKPRQLSLPEVVAWAERSDSIDCPMTQEEAGLMWDYRDGSSRSAFIRALGCACSVHYTCDGPARDSERCNLRGRLAAFRGQAERSDATPGDRALVAWGERLRAKDGADARALTRVETLLTTRPALSDDEQKNTEIFGALTTGIRDMDESIRIGSWSLVDDYYDNFRVNLVKLEKDILCGRESRPGRALLAEADKRMDRARVKIEQWNQVERTLRRDPAYRSLTAREDRIRAKALRMALDQHIPDGDFGAFCAARSADKSTLCRLNEELGEINYQQHQISERVQLRVGYITEPSSPSPPR